MIKHFMSKQFMVFLVTGGIAALVNFGSRFVYSLWFEFPVAIVLAYITGMITAFVLAKCFVFKNSTRPIHHSAFIFVLVNVAAVAQTLIISLVLADYVLPYFEVIKYRLAVSHGIGVLFPVFTSYLGHKRFSFGEARQL